MAPPPQNQVSSSKKKYLWLLLLIIITSSCFVFFKENKTEKTQEQKLSQERLSQNSHSQTPSIQKRERQISAIDSDQVSRQSAEEWLTQNKEKYQIQKHHRAQYFESKHPLGSTTRYHFYQEGLRIYGVEIIVKRNQQGHIINVDNQYRPLEKINLPSQINEGSFQNQISKQGYQVTSEDSVKQPLLFALPYTNKPQYAYSVTAKDKFGHKEWNYIFRYPDGQILMKSQPRGSIHHHE